MLFDVIGLIPCARSDATRPTNSSNNTTTTNTTNTTTTTNNNNKNSNNTICNVLYCTIILH